MNSQTITLDPRWDIEHRKLAINQAMEAHAPFHLKAVKLALPGMEPQDYTGGMTQIVLAQSCTLEFTSR